MTREQKLETALRAATKLRKSFKDIGVAVLLVPREVVEEYDAVIEKLRKDKNAKA